MITEQTEQINKITFNRFGNGIGNNVSLLNETNKMFNLCWKPIKVKEQIVQKIIPGMPKNININNNVYKPSSVFNLNEKLEELKKKEEEQNSTIRITNLPSYISIKELYDLFDLFGKIEERGVRIKDYSYNTMAFIKYIFISYIC